MVPTKMAKEGTWGTRQKYQTIKITKTLVKTVRSNLIRNLDNIVKGLQKQTTEQKKGDLNTAGYLYVTHHISISTTAVTVNLKNSTVNSWCEGPWFWREHSRSCSQRILFFCFVYPTVSPKGWQKRDFSFFHLPQSSISTSISMQEALKEHCKTKNKLMPSRAKKTNKRTTWSKQQTSQTFGWKSWGVRFHRNKGFEKFLWILQNLEATCMPRARGI